VIKYYRRLLREGFQNTGEIENPSIFLDSVEENIPICGQIGRDFMHVYLEIINDKIEDIKYLCTCDPTANVVIEVLCSLVKNRTISQAEALTPDSFRETLAEIGEDTVKKAKGTLELLNRGLTTYKTTKTA